LREAIGDSSLRSEQALQSQRLGLLRNSIPRNDTGFTKYLLSKSFYDIRHTIYDIRIIEMGRDMSILCLDVGNKTIGIAVSDSLQTIACGVGQFRRDESGNSKEIEYIKGLISQYKADKLVVGLPINMRGGEGQQAKKVHSFVDDLSSSINIPVVLADERLSTVAAERVLREAKVSPLKRRKVRDKMAAIIILQSYLDSRRP